MSQTPTGRIGVDVGGTFTDLAFLGDDGQCLRIKVPTVPDDPASGVLAAVERAASELGTGVHGLLSQCRGFVHGTTIGTNALLTGKGPVVGLLATAGFRDTLAQRRGHRDDVWAFRTADPPVLVRRSRRIGIRERVGADGSIVEPINTDDVRVAVRLFREQGVQAVAIGFLFGYLNPTHEKIAAAIIRSDMPDIFVTASHDVSPIIGEYERIATTAVNAFLGPLVARYLDDLGGRLTMAGLTCAPLVAQSNGGVADLLSARRRPAMLALSGPAAGMAAGRAIARWLNSPNLISIDMGGTSFDVGVIVGGEVTSRTDLTIGGQQIALPSVDVHTVGTGGGSIARVDGGGVLRVGPEGAGARPGPAAYGFGGVCATVTDANLVLGRLDPSAYFGGRMRLDPQLARDAIDRDVALPLGISIEAAARGIVAVATAQMADAIRLMTVERGLDPRRFTLLAAGGAAPMHASEIATALRMKHILIPRSASIYCALGMLTADLTLDGAEPHAGNLNVFDATGIQQVIDRMVEPRLKHLLGLGFDESAITYRASLDARYVGRHREIHLPIGSARLTELDGPRLRAVFDELVGQRFGHADSAASVEFVTVRVAVTAETPPVVMPRLPRPNGDSIPHPTGIRTTLLATDHPLDLPVFQGNGLGPGQIIQGPAIVEDAGMTSLLWPTNQLTVDEFGNYLVLVGGSEKRIDDPVNVGGMTVA